MDSENQDQTTERDNSETQSQPSAKETLPPVSKLRDMIPEKDPMGAGIKRPSGSEIPRDQS